MFTILILYLIVGVFCAIVLGLVAMYRDAVEELAKQELPSQEFILGASLLMVPLWLIALLFSIYMHYHPETFKK